MHGRFPEFKGASRISFDIDTHRKVPALIEKSFAALAATQELLARVERLFPRNLESRRQAYSVLSAKHLALANRHVEEGAKIVERQRRLIQQMERDGHDTRAARRLLSEFEEFHVTQIADQERFAQELCESSER